MDLTSSYEQAIPAPLRGRYEWLEVRNAAAVLRASNPAEFQDITAVLDDFKLDEQRDLVAAGGNETQAAALLNTAFRDRGWREADFNTRIHARLTKKAWSNETAPTVVETEAETSSFLIDNVKGRVAVDVEWHAKEGHLDRDLAAYRSLYQEAHIDAAVIITVLRGELRRRAREIDATSTKFQTSTTTSIEKAKPKLIRGDGGGCPVLVAGVCLRTI